MSAYLSSTTFGVQPTGLLGAALSPSSEWAVGGALSLGVAAALLVALCVAARALETSVERRRKRGVATKKRVGERRKASTGRVALRCAAFWSIVAASVWAFLPWPTTTVPQSAERCELCENAEAEETARDKATVSQETANAAIKESKREGDRGTAKLRSTFATDAVEEKAPLVAYRPVSENVDKAEKARWLQSASGELTLVEQIRAESDLEIDASRSSLKPANLSDAETARTVAPRNSNKTNAQVSAEKVAWRRRAAEQTSTLNGQVSQFAQSSQNLPSTQNDRLSLLAQPAQSSTAAQTAQNLAAAQAVRPAQTAQTAQTAQNLAAAQTVRPAQTAQTVQTVQNLAAAQTVRPAQTAQAAQNLTTAQNRENGTSQRWQDTSAQGAVVASVYNERRNWKTGTKNVLAQEFEPSRPIVPYPSDDRGVSIAPVSYQPRAAEEPLSLLEQIDAEFQRIGALVRKSVLSIETVKRGKTKSTKNAVETGCGFLFQYKEKIYLATNWHVVKDATSNRNVKIFLPDQTSIHPTKILTCADFDLAALELDPASLPSDGSVSLCFFGNSDDLRVSNFVGTIGNPFGLRDTVTYGHVSSLQRRKNDFTNDGEQSLLEFLQIDASINPGNSGGPLYNARGEVVGVVAAIATTTGKSEGVAFAIPINLALNVLKSTIDAGGWSRSYMGVELEAATRADFQNVELPIKGGSKIVGVNDNSPAERAGLRSGDVVVEFDGEAIEDDLHFARLIAITDVSREANVKFLRGARLLQTTARLERADAE